MKVPAEVAIVLERHGEDPQMAYVLARTMAAFGAFGGVCATLSVLLIVGLL